MKQMLCPYLTSYRFLPWKGIPLGFVKEDLTSFIGEPVPSHVVWWRQKNHKSVSRCFQWMRNWRQWRK